MMELSKDVLSNLRCFYCEHYLSYSPIMSDKENRNVCGRCNIPEDHRSSFIQNHLYEELATVLSFPCKNHQNGCSVKLTTKDVKEHEDTCMHSLHFCPIIDENCSWVGKMDMLQTHYQTCHPGLVILNPYNQKPNIRKYNQANMMITSCGFAFLVQVESNITQDKILYSVIYLGTQSLSNIFEFSIKIGMNNNYCTIVRRIEPNNKLELNENNSIVLSIQKLISEFDNYDDIDFQLSISIREVNCWKCNKRLNHAPIYQSESGHSCPGCSRNQEKSPRKQTGIRDVLCERSDRGCHYKQSDKFLLKKHQQWLCSYGRYGNERWIDYFAKRDSISLIPIVNGDVSTVICRDVPFCILPRDERVHYSFRANGILFILGFKFTTDILSIHLISDTEDHGDKHFKCGYKMWFPGVGIDIFDDLHPQTNNSWGTYIHAYDWRIDIYLPSTHLPLSLPDKCNLELTVTNHYQNGYTFEV